MSRVRMIVTQRREIIEVAILRQEYEAIQQITNEMFGDFYDSKRIEISDDGRVISLNLSNLELKVLDQSIGELNSLSDLAVDYNNCLTSLPDTIGNLCLLEKFSVDYGYLTSLPDTIGNLGSLKLFTVCKNQLTSLPKSIGNLSSLQILDVNYNCLTSLPESIGNLSSLQDFYAVGNQFDENSRKLLVELGRNTNVVF